MVRVAKSLWVIVGLSLIILGRFGLSLILDHLSPKP